MEETVEFKWLFSEEQLRKTPSVRDGITHAQELVFRQKQAMLMQAIGQKSGLTQLAINTSVIFMHRFYMFRSIKFFPRIHISIGFVFAAGKVEESARKLEHLIRYTVDILRNNKNGEFLDKRDKLTYEMDCEWREKIESLIQNNCDVTSTAYEEMRKNVLECEAEIYAVIGFMLQITHPHKFVIRMSGLLGAENIKDISQYAYNLATVSSQLTMLNLKYKPELIATVCLNIASKAHSVKFMCMKDSSINWYQVHDPSTDMKDIEAVSEEFLNLIKACQLLPSWMTNLARAPPRSMSRSQPGTSKSLSTAAHSVSHAHKPGPPSSSSASHHPHHPSSSSSQIRDVSKQAPSQPAPLHSTTDSLLSQASSAVTTSTALSIPQGNGSSSLTTTTTSSSHLPGQSHRSSSSMTDPHSLHHREGRPPHPSTSASAHQRPTSGSRPHSHQAQQHPQHPRSHPPPVAPRNNSHHKPSVPAASSGSSRMPPSSSSSSSSSSRPSGNRAAHHPGMTSASSNHPLQSRPEHARRPDAQDSKRPQSQPPVEESNHNHLAPVLESQSSSSNLSHLNEIAKTSPPSKSLTPPELAPQPTQVSEAPQGVTDFLASPSESLDLNKPRQINQSSKLTLSSYRERNIGKIRSGPQSSQSESVTDDSGIQTGASEENYSLDLNHSSMVDSPANSSVKSVSTPDLTSAFSVPQDSPTNPRLKLKVKRDPSVSEKLSVKYADSGLKIKIKPPKVETKEEEVAGPSNRSTTPMEEGEVVDSPGSTGSSDRKSEGSLKIRLNIPKRAEGGSGDAGANGIRVDDQSSSSHRSHHHRSHHHRHHSHKSKKHSSRHEGKSSKRSGGEYYEERPPKSSRLDYLPPDAQSTLSFRGSSLQHQNSGFSINDAFSSTMPSNIFDDEEDSAMTVAPPITPTPDMIQAPSGQQLFRVSSRKPPSHSSTDALQDDHSDPPHHQRFHQLVAQHRAAEAARKPPLPPLPASNQPPPPPPPPPPRSPPPPPAY